MASPSFISAHAAHADWQAALARCFEQLAHAVAKPAMVARHTLGWCYITDPFARSANDILAQLQHRLPDTHWVGTVGQGIAASGTEYFEQPAIVLMLAELPKDAFRLFSGRQPLRPDAFPAHTALVHADATTPDLQDLLPELAERTRSGYLFGGLSSARRSPVQFADAVLTGGLSGVAFDERVGIVSRVTQGCQPIGPTRRITRAENNVVITLDGVPALACVLQDLGLASDLATEDMASALSTTLVGLSAGHDGADSHAASRFGTDTLVRHIVGLDPRARVLAIGDTVQTGSQLAFCRRDPAVALADVSRIAREIQADLGRRDLHVAGAHYVSCVGRGGPHFGSPNAELRAIRAVLGDVPLAGFFAGGEIANDRLYGYTGVLTVFTATGRR